MADLDALLDEALDDFESIEGGGAQAGSAAAGAVSGVAAAKAPTPPMARDAAPREPAGPAERARGADDDGNDDPLVDELAASMEQLMESISKSDDGKLMRQLEDALSQLEREAREQQPGSAVAERAAAAAGGQSGDGAGAGGDGSDGGGGGGDGVPSAAQGAHDASAEQTLRMLARSAEALSSGSAGGRSGGGGSEDALGANLLKKLAEGLDSMSDNDEFATAVEGMMAQLLSRDVMLEPLTQLRALFGPWMEAHAAELHADERARYEAQQACLAQIVAAYEAGEDGAPVMALMHEMQRHGQPPKELMRELAPGIELEALLDGGEGEEGGKDLPCCVM
ncbi:hypothetical protein KFE25_014260 [Diacronema lutheri]|uniref:Peroxin-19 n=1 Tax=Diacronema lutheri TaxID=2081491 RepID=A0A8J6C7U8_DIALT|nr:hypothetical protein KFE25_014260 [Diacronema lutheri]